jgi:hypothetical protein
VIQLAQYLNKGLQPRCKEIQELLKIDFLLQFRQVWAPRQFREKMMREITELLQCNVNYGKVMIGICRHFGHDPSASEDFIAFVQRFRRDFEGASGWSIVVDSEIREISSDLIAAVISKNLAIKKKELEETENTLTDLRYKNHTCPVCRYRPAIYLAKPCLHPSFCSGCINELTSHGGTFTHCFVCKAKVESVQPLSYLT